MNEGGKAATTSTATTCLGDNWGGRRRRAGRNLILMDF